MAEKACHVVASATQVGLTQALGAMGRKSFIPRDKPKSWVVFVLSALTGLAFGLCAFAAASYGLPIAKIIFLVGFAVCWTVGALAGITCGIGMATGQYGDLQEKPWRDQVW